MCWAPFSGWKVKGQSHMGCSKFWPCPLLGFLLIAWWNKSNILWLRHATAIRSPDLMVALSTEIFHGRLGADLRDDVTTLTLIIWNISQKLGEVTHRSRSLFLPLSPPGWRGIVVMVRAGGQADGRLPDLRNPYLCNRSTCFLRSKFCGIV